LRPGFIIVRHPDLSGNTMAEKPARATPVSVAVVAICSEQHLLRCLTSLEAQRGAPPFEIVVAAAPRLGDLSAMAQRFPETRFVEMSAEATPAALAATAVRESASDFILLTEDHCSAHRDWVATLLGSLDERQRTVGGPLDPLPGMRSFDWAFYFVDFFRYMSPRKSGWTRSLSVCNVGYRAADLREMSGDWRSAFHETRVHEELRRKCGPHYFDARARMTTGRQVGYRDGHRERYAFGRIFAAQRISSGDRARRLLYSIGSATLPPLLLGRMALRAVREPGTARRYVASLPHLFTLVMAWSWGEFLGYSTGRLPGNRDAARERATA